MHLERTDVTVQPGPLVFDTQVLGRRPGTERTFTRTIEAPPDLGYDVYGVPEGSSIDLELRLEAVMDGVLATGTASAQVVGECVRCLDPLRDQFVADFQELYVYDPIDTGNGDDDGESDEEMVLEDELLDLEPVLRDAVVLALPHNPVCDPECPGLCPECGARLADDPDHTHGDPVDPRWATLSRLTQDQTQNFPGDASGSSKE